MAKSAGSRDTSAVMPLRRVLRTSSATLLLRRASAATSIGSRQPRAEPLGNAEVVAVEEQPCRKAIDPDDGEIGAPAQPAQHARQPPQRDMPQRFAPRRLGEEALGQISAPALGAGEEHTRLTARARRGTVQPGDRNADSAQWQQVCVGVPEAILGRCRHLREQPVRAGGNRARVRAGAGRSARRRRGRIVGRGHRSPFQRRTIFRHRPNPTLTIVPSGRKPAFAWTRSATVFSGAVARIARRWPACCR